MDLFTFLTIGTAGLVVAGIGLLAGIIWNIASRRDELYRQKYEEFLEQRQRVRDRMRKRDRGGA